MDISVHCDLSTFEWLMRWVKSASKENLPTLSKILFDFKNRLTYLLLLSLISQAVIIIIYFKIYLI